MTDDESGEEAVNKSDENPDKDKNTENPDKDQNTENPDKDQNMTPDKGSPPTEDDPGVEQ